MHGVYWGCLLGGSIFALVTLIFGDILGDVLGGIADALSSDHLDFIQPMVIVGAITVFGGAGIMLSNYTALGALPVLLYSAMAAVLSSAVTYFAYVRPMKRSENSTGFSLRDLVGKIGEITVPVPLQGYGEVMIRAGAGNTNQIAGSLDGEELPSGTRVVVGEVKDNVLYVFRYEE